MTLKPNIIAKYIIKESFIDKVFEAHGRNYIRTKILLTQ
jgi:hypothetical protein